MLILVNADLENVLLGGNHSRLRGVARLTNIVPHPTGECFVGLVRQKGQVVGTACRYHHNPNGWYVFDAS